VAGCACPPPSAGHEPLPDACSRHADPSAHDDLPPPTEGAYARARVGRSMLELLLSSAAASWESSNCPKLHAARRGARGGCDQTRAEDLLERSTGGVVPPRGRPTPTPHAPQVRITDVLCRGAHTRHTSS
jgi:hypothetical protein